MIHHPSDDPLLVWLPPSSTLATLTNPARTFANRYASVTPGWSDLFGTEPTWGDFLERICRYPVAQTLLTLSQMSIALKKDDSLNGQVTLANTLFDRNPRPLRERFASYVAQPDLRDAECPPALFHPAQLLNTAKLALRYQDLGYSTAADSLEPLGEALLMLTDLAVPRRARDMIETEAELIASSLFAHNDVPVHGLARTYDLYLTNRPHVASKYGIDLPRIIAESTGLDPDLMWLLIWSLYAHFQSLPIEESGHPFFVDKYLERFSETERQQVMLLVSCSAEELSERLQRSFSIDDVRPYNVLEFATWPLIRFGPKSICLSIELLKKKLVTGVHYLFLDLIESRDRRQLYLTARGDIVGDYVDRLWRRVFPEISGRYFNADQIHHKASGKICDGALYYGDAMIFFEVKAKQFDLPARVGVAERIDDKLGDIVYEGAAQLDATERAFRDESLAIEGVKSFNVRTVYPLLILLEHLVLNPLTYKRIVDEVSRRRLLTGTGIRPLQIITIAELEHIETAMDRSRFSFLDVLADKTQSAEWIGASLTNYLMSRYADFFAAEQNAYLRGVYDQQIARVQRLASDRKL